MPYRLDAHFLFILNMKIAVIQLNAVPLDSESNFARASQFIRSASLQGAELAVLPEYHLTAWAPESEKFAELCGQGKHYLEKYQELAKELSICIVPGTIVQRVKDNQGNEILLNVAYFLGKNGEILGEYTKKNLWHAERGHLTSSGRDEHKAFETPFGFKAGMLVCWDLAFPEAFRHLILQGAKLIIIPSYWNLSDCSEEGLAYNPNSEGLFLDSTLISRAFENTCAIVFCNIGGPSGASDYAGRSQVTMPFIGPLARLGSGAEGVLLVDLDMNILEHAERNYKVRADLARSDWHYDYFKDAQ